MSERSLVPDTLLHASIDICICRCDTHEFRATKQDFRNAETKAQRIVEIFNFYGCDTNIIFIYFQIV